MAVKISEFETFWEFKSSPIMLCLFLLFGKLRGVLLGTYPSIRRLSETPSCQISLRLLCGFSQIAMILSCILLKLSFLDSIHVAYVVLGVAVVGGEHITNIFMLLIWFKLRASSYNNTPCYTMIINRHDHRAPTHFPSSAGLSELPQVSMHYQPNDDALPWPLGQGTFDYATTHDGRLGGRAQSLGQQCGWCLCYYIVEQ